MVLRPASLVDLASLVALERQVFGPDAYGEDKLAAVIRAAQRGAGSPTLGGSAEALATDVTVATIDDRVIACSVGEVWALHPFCERYGIDRVALAARIGATTPVGYLKSLAVAPAWRRRGIGTALTVQRLRFFESLSARAALLMQMQREGLVEFHRSLGFSALPIGCSLRYADGRPATLWHRPGT